MASAKRIDELATKKTDLRPVQLTLTVEEATTLAYLTGSIGGLESGRRGHVTSIRDALINVHVDLGHAARDIINGGVITFKDKVTPVS